MLKKLVLRGMMFVSLAVGVFGQSQTGGATLNGTVTDPVCIGKGTLLVSGKITFSSDATVGTTANPVYLVSQTADVQFLGTWFTITGGIYANGDFNYRANNTINGPLVLGGSTVYGPSAKPSSNLTVNPGVMPWFDPRGGGFGVTISKFAGPRP